MAGNVPPDTENPVPVTVAELTVTAAVPTDLSVTGWVVGVLITTVPKDTLVALTLSVAVPPVVGFSCSENVFETPFAVAVRVTACVVLTAATVAVKFAVVALLDTVTEPGTVTTLLLLERLTLTPPLPAALLSVTVHASVPAPVIEALVQDNALTVGPFAPDDPLP